MRTHKIKLRSKICEKYLKLEGLNCMSIKEECIDPFFSNYGCCICRVATDVYDCNGYNPKTKDIQDGYEVCGECINYFYNGEESEV